MTCMTMAKIKNDRAKNKNNRLRNQLVKTYWCSMKPMLLTDHLPALRKMGWNCDANEKLPNGAIALSNGHDRLWMEQFVENGKTYLCGSQFVANDVSVPVAYLELVTEHDLRFYGEGY